MKYKIISAVAITGALAIALTANTLPVEGRDARMHQHLTSKQHDESCGCAGSELCTNLPIVIIDTFGKEIPGKAIENEDGTEEITLTDGGDEMLSITVSIIDNESGNNRPGDSAALTTESLIKVRGASSRYFDKSSYLLRFTDGNGEYTNEPVMGMDAHYEWVLYGAYLDKTLIRNYMWYNIAGEIMEWAPNVRFCELILNGEYRGLYLMCESVTAGDNCRLSLSDAVGDESGYLLRLDRGSSNEIKNIDTFSVLSWRTKYQIDIKYPRSGSLTDELIFSIKSDFSDFEKALYSYDYDTDDYGYWNYIDVDSWVDYFIINEFTMNYDAVAYSTYIYKDIGGKYKLAVWDFDSAFDNFAEDQYDPDGLWLQGRTWYFMLIKDEYFTSKIISRYNELREGVLSEEYLMDYIDSTLEYLGGAIERNFEVWGYTFEDDEMLTPAERNLGSYEEAIEQYIDMIKQRGDWLDENIEVIQQYSHESKNKKYNH
ncbi:MAG: CotH kinase family protein [Clostridiales bacterium]|nr:CotH kinase family protein [Clostridiales bacterium]